ncbi:MAG: ferritin-like domain-containing protein [Candidatus Aminicenantes bacterium]|nr:ferritin-like domain-containing protein [Candidatus Aminicenantes bacterium]
MKNKELITMLNRDLRDEHAAVVRYLIHSYLEGEDTALGAKLLSRTREEMWHMHWLGMIIAQKGGEPDMTPAAYPHDPTSRAAIFKSYVAYEKKLIPHYNREADKVNDPHIKRVLRREAWESGMHAAKFQKILDKLSPEEAEGLPGGENELPGEFVNKLQKAVAGKYTQMLQHIRDSWVFQKEAAKAWQIMDFSMTQMKQLAHLAEDVAENGMPPRFELGEIEKNTSIGLALERAVQQLRKSRERHIELTKDPEAQKHKGFMANLDLTLKQEQYEQEEIEDLK